MRLIDADELMKHIRFVYHPVDDNNYNLLKDIIDSASTIEERKKGKWTGVATFECSVCHETSCCAGNYCMNCGADMRSEKNND